MYVMARGAGGSIDAGGDILLLGRSIVAGRGAIVAEVGAMLKGVNRCWEKESTFEGGI